MEINHKHLSINIIRFIFNKGCVMQKLFKDSYEISNIQDTRNMFVHILNAIKTTKETYPTLSPDEQWRLLLELQTGLVDMYHNDENNILGDLGAYNNYFPYTVSLDEAIVIDNMELYSINPKEYFDDIGSSFATPSEIFKFEDLDELNTFFKDIELKYEYLYQSNCLNFDGSIDNEKVAFKFDSISNLSHNMGDMLVITIATGTEEIYNKNMNNLFDKIFEFKLENGELPKFVTSKEDVRNLIQRAKDFESVLPEKFKKDMLSDGSSLVPKDIKELCQTNYIIPFVEKSLYIEEISKSKELDVQR